MSRKIPKTKTVKTPKPRNIPLLSHIQRGGAGAGRHKSGKAYRRREKHRQHRPNPFQPEGSATPRPVFTRLGVDLAYYDAVSDFFLDVEAGKYGQKAKALYKRALTTDGSEAEDAEDELLAFLTAESDEAASVEGREFVARKSDKAFTAVMQDVLADARAAGGAEAQDIEQLREEVRGEIGANVMLEAGLDRRIKTAPAADLKSYLEGTITHDQIGAPKSALRAEYKRLYGWRAPNMEARHLSAAIDAMRKAQAEYKAHFGRDFVRGVGASATPDGVRMLVLEDQYRKLTGRTFPGLRTPAQMAEAVHEARIAAATEAEAARSGAASAAARRTRVRGKPTAEIEVSPTPSSGDDLEAMSFKDLRALRKGLGLKGARGESAADVRAQIRASRGASAVDQDEDEEYEIDLEDEAAYAAAAAAEAADDEDEDEDEEVAPAGRRGGGMLGLDLTAAARGRSTRAQSRKEWAAAFLGEGSPKTSRDKAGFDPGRFDPDTVDLGDFEEADKAPRKLKRLGGAGRERALAEDQSSRAQRLSGFTEQVATRRTPAGLGPPEGRPTDEVLAFISQERAILLYKLPTGETQVWIKPVRDARTARGWSGLTETFVSRQGQASHFAAKAYVQNWRGVVGSNRVREDVRKSRPRTAVYLAVATQPDQAKLILPPLIVDAGGGVVVGEAPSSLEDLASALSKD